MQGMANQVVDEQSQTADAQAFVHEVDQLRRLEVMGEKVAADKIEAGIPEGKRQGIGDDGAIVAIEMGAGAVEQGGMELNTAAAQTSTGVSGNIAGAGRDLEQGKRFRARLASYLRDQVRGGAHTTKAGIEKAQVTQAAAYFSRCAGVGVQQFGNDHAAHKVIDDGRLTIGRV